MENLYDRVSRIIETNGIRSRKISKAIDILNSKQFQLKDDLVKQLSDEILPRVKGKWIKETINTAFLGKLSHIIRYVKARDVCINESCPTLIEISGSVITVENNDIYHSATMGNIITITAEDLAKNIADLITSEDEVWEKCSAIISNHEQFIMESRNFRYYWDDDDNVIAYYAMHYFPYESFETSLISFRHNDDDSLAWCNLAMNSPRLRSIDKIVQDKDKDTKSSMKMDEAWTMAGLRSFKQTLRKAIYGEKGVEVAESPNLNP